MYALFIATKNVHTVISYKPAIVHLMPQFNIYFSNYIVQIFRLLWQSIKENNKTVQYVTNVEIN